MLEGKALDQFMDRFFGDSCAQSLPGEEESGQELEEYELKEDGIMVNQQGSPFYSEDAHAMQRSHKRIASTFQISRVYQAHIPTFAAGYWLFGFASKKYHPVDDLDPEAWNALNLRTRYYTTRLHRGAFYLPAFLEEMLQEVED